MQKETDNRHSGDILLGAMGAFSIWHWLIVAVIVILLFGRNKISSVMGDVAQGIKSFKRGMAEDDQPATVADGRATERPETAEAERTRGRTTT